MSSFRSQALVWPVVLGLLVACQAASPTPDASQPTPFSPPVTASAEPPSVAARVAAARPPASLDPALVSLPDATGRDLVENLYVGLTQLDPATNSVTPALATTWAVSSDGLRWTFMLRDDVMWAAFDPATDAVTTLRPVTAADAVYAIWRACHPATNAPHAADLFVIHGCREINNTDPALITEQMLAQTIHAVAVNPTSLSIELEEEAAHFLTLTAQPILRPVAREAFAPEEAEWREGGLEASSGPFVIEAHTPGEGMTLVANPGWPLPREGNVTTVEVRFAGDEARAYAAFQASEADIAPLPGAQAQAAAPGSLTVPQPRVSFLAFATDQFPMDDVRVRRALAAAIDRERIVEEVLGGDGLVTAGFAPPGSVGAPTDAEPSAYDPDYAQQQIAAAGYPNCQIFPRVTLLTDESALSRALAQTYIQMWQDTLGCNDTRFDLQQDDLNVVLGFASTPLLEDWQTRPHLYALTWQADYPDANNWWGDVLHCERGYLQLGRACEAVDDLIERAAREQDAAARAVLYAEIEALFFGEDGLQPIAPIYTETQTLAVQPWLTVPVTGGPARYDRWLVGDAP